jgi:hypothetical protein
VVLTGVLGTMHYVTALAFSARPPHPYELRFPVSRPGPATGVVKAVPCGVSFCESRQAALRWAGGEDAGGCEEGGLMAANAARDVPFDDEAQSHQAVEEILEAVRRRKH